MDNNEKQYQTTKNMLATGIALYLFYPIKLLQLRLQNSTAMKTLGIINEPYKGVTDAFSRIAKSEGFRAFWQGGLLYSIYQVCFRFADRRKMIRQMRREYRN